MSGFDELKSWNQKMTADFMKRKKGVSNFADSEPQFLIRYVDRHKDWAVILCLVGGGQEINRGESGIGAWLEAVRTSFPHWNMYISSRLTDSEYAAADVTDHSRQPAYYDSTFQYLVDVGIPVL